MRIGRLAWIVAVGLAALALPGARAAAAEKTVDVTVMTFNIRFDFESDRAAGNAWKDRKDAVAKTIAESGAEVVCLQEDKEDQLADLEAALPGFGRLGRGRTKAGHGEHCAILYDKKTVTVQASGDFWLSETPDEPGSQLAGDEYPRKATWALLSTKGKRSLFVVSLHLVEGKEAKEVALRKRSAEICIDWIESHLGDPKKETGLRLASKDVKRLPIVVAGDFNSAAADPESESYGLFVGKDGAGFRDAWDAAPGDGAPGTFHAFQGLETASRIDWLLLRGTQIAKVQQTRKIRPAKGERYPSDHFPFITKLTLK